MPENVKSPDIEQAPDGLVQVLPDNLANKIAAGEVVQRPASVLKELLENSIDAGARNISIILKDAGSELIRVVDDGAGMGPEDAVRSLSRHATSKIRDVEDLERILTLGFRGEALASIASVSHLELKTRRQSDEAAFFVRTEGGENTETGPTAAPVGTSVAVRHLFFNVPARRNFLKTAATELKHLIETFQFIAVSHPEVGFTVFHDEAELYRLSASDKSLEDALELRLVELFGEKYRGSVLPVAETTSYVSVTGLIGRPELAKRSRAEQFLYVNGRYVRNRSLEHAVFSAFDGLIPKESRPHFALFLTLDPRHVDVNVHPTKTEIKFDDDRGIYSFLRAVVRKALGAADLVPGMGDGASGGSVFDLDHTEPPTASFPGWERDNPSPTPSGGYTPRADSFDPSFGASIDPATFASIPGRIPSEARPFGADDNDDLGLESKPPVWPLHGRYLVTPIRSGLLVVDQRLAHERILYEQALEEMDGGLGGSQQLVFPIVIDFSPETFALVQELLPDIRSLGFHVEPFGGRTVKVHGVPADIKPGREITILEDIIEDFQSHMADDRRDGLARSFARCRAFRHGHGLSEQESRSLIDQLFACEMPFASPDGRPTMVKLSMDELERRFGRT